MLKALVIAGLVFLFAIRFGAAFKAASPHREIMVAVSLAVATFLAVMMLKAGPLLWAILAGIALILALFSLRLRAGMRSKK